MEIDFFGNPFDQQNSLIEDSKRTFDRSKADSVNIVPYTSYNLINNKANPFKIGDRVTLDLTKDARYSQIQNLKPTDIPRVSAILGESMVNIGFSYSQPMTVKSINVKHISIVKTSRLIDRLRVLFKSISIVRRLTLKLIDIRLYISARRRIKKLNKRK